MTRHARAERLGLCDDMLARGAEAPTLSGDWTVAELAAHLVIREGRPHQAAGIVLPPLAKRTDRATRELAARSTFEELVERVRQGPPAWHPAHVGAVDEAVNLVEMFVHREDVRRAGPDPSRRTLEQSMVSALWGRLRVMARPLLRRAEDTVVMVTAKDRVAVTRSGRPSVEVHGAPGELLLFAFGRQQVAQVELVGPPDAVQRLLQARLGL